jgi:adenine-specific DNA-methyltransferase
MSNSDQPNTINKTTPDLLSERISKLKELMPDLFDGDGNLDEIALRDLATKYSIPKPEKFKFDWNGKQGSKSLAFQPSGATLTENNQKSKKIPLLRGGTVSDGVDFVNSKNLLIEGDNLEVLKLLQKSYNSKIKCIYIDPPYNTGKDFIYTDNYSQSKSEYWQTSGVVDQEGIKLESNPESSGKYHSNWLNMMQPRLLLARNLMREDGVIFVSIDDHEVHNLRKLMDEVFGEENFRNYIITRRRVKSLNLQFVENGLKSLNVGYEYILVYAKTEQLLLKEVRSTKEIVPTKGVWNVFWSGADRPTMRYNLLDFTPLDGQWRWSKEKALEAIQNYNVFLTDFAKEITLEEYWINTGKSKKFIRKIEDGKGKNGGVQYWIGPSETSLRNTNWTDIEVSEIQKEFNLPFENPKSVKLLKTIVDLANLNKNDLILDFFAGSGTTGQAVMELNAEDGGNRQFILVQIPESTDEKSEANKSGYKTIFDITAERVRRAGDKIISDPKHKETAFSLDIGFRVLSLSPSNFPENNFFRDGSKSEEENLQAFQEYLEREKQNQLIDTTNSDDLIMEIAIKQGYDLGYIVEEVSEFQPHNTVYLVKDNTQQMLLCLDSSIKEQIVDILANYTQINFICLSSALETNTKWNLEKAITRDRLFVF